MGCTRPRVGPYLGQIRSSEGRLRGLRGAIDGDPSSRCERSVSGNLGLFWDTAAHASCWACARLSSNSDGATVDTL